MRKSLILLTSMVALVLFGCKERAYIDAPGENSHNLDSIPAAANPLPTPDPEGADVPEGCLDVYEACKLCKTMASGETTDESYYVKGWISRLDSKNESGITDYGNATFYISANKDVESMAFEAYQVMGKDGKKLVDVGQVQVGDFVVIYGQIMNYNGTPETVGKGAAYIYYSNNPDFDIKIDPTRLTPDPEGVNVPEGCLNVYEAVELCEQLGSGKTTTEEYYVKGWICRLDSKNESGITSYGNATFYIAPTNDGYTAVTFEAYQVYGMKKKKITNVNQVAVGDYVILRGKLTNYNGTAETVGQGKSYIYYSNNPNMVSGRR